MNELQKNRNDAVQRIAQLEDQLSNLNRQIQRASPQDNQRPVSPLTSAGNVHSVRPKTEAAQLRSQVEQVGRQLSDSRGYLADIERQIQFADALEGAEAEVVTAGKEHKKAQSRVQEIEVMRDRAAERLTKRRADFASELAMLERHQSDAAKDYATALKSEDASQIKSSEQRLSEAGRALDEARARQDVQQQVVDAIENDVTALEADLENAIKVAAGLHKQLHQAKAIVAGKQWDAKVQELVQIGAELLVARRLGGLNVGALDKVHLPVFSTYRAGPVMLRDIESAAAGSSDVADADEAA
ncbi:MAG: hypothetical protein ACRBBM_10980 [Pseudomonadaceae bacterium]|jgi:DNA repair exonuclease SbcCD ATPase subunit